MNTTEYRIIRQAQHPVGQWSGGSTTQLAIYPPEAIYVERNFQWRISTAIVEPGQSVFTALPGYKRHLLVLAGEMQLVHEDWHQAMLGPGHQDTFCGSWVTHCTCIGQGRDFNLMLAAGWEGRLQMLSLQHETELVSVPMVGGTEQTEAFYCVSGKAKCVWAEQQAILENGDILLLYRCFDRMKLSNLNPGAKLQLVQVSVGRTESNLQTPPCREPGRH